MHANEEQIKTATMVNQTLTAIFAVIGPVLGTMVYQAYGIYASIGIISVTFLLSASVLISLPKDRSLLRNRNQTGKIGREMLEGLRYVWLRKELAILCACLAVCGLALGIHQPLGIFLVTERLALPEEYLQWLSMIGGAGMIAGGRLMMAAQFFGYLVYPLIQASISILVFKHTEETFVGRVNGLRNSLLTGAMIMGISLAGWLKGFLSIVVLYQLIAALFLLGMMITWPLLSSPDQKVVHKRSCRTVPKEKD